MMKKNIFLLIIYTTIYSSCVKDVDFNQIEDLKLKPTFVSALANTTLKQTAIINSSGVEINQFKDVSRFDVFSNSVFEKVEKLIVNFEINNQFDRDFTIALTFFDDNATLTYQFPLISVSENVENYKYSHEIIITDSPQILESKNLDVTVNLLPSTDGSIIDINEDKSFTFNSSGTFFLKID